MHASAAGPQPCCTLQAPKQGWLDDVRPDPVPLHSCLLLIRYGLGSYGTDLSQAAEGWAGASVRLLLQRSVACLFQGEPGVRQAVLQGVLPAAADCAALIGAAMHEAFLAVVWECARYLLVLLPHGPGDVACLQ